MKKNKILLMTLFIIGMFSTVNIALYTIFSQSNTTIIAHRGDNQNFPEESMSAYKSAIQKGVDYVEMDIRKTKDNVLILHHDGNLNRMTGVDKEIKDINYSDLRKIKLKDSKGNITRETIPTLESIFMRYKNTTKYYIQLDYIDKNDTRPNDIPKRAIDLAKKYKIEKNRIIFQAWKWETLDNANKIDSNYHYVRLGFNERLKEISLLKQRHMGVGMLDKDVNEKIVKELKSNKIPIHVYIYENKEKEQINIQKNLKKYDIDGVFTDYIDFSLKNWR